MIQGLNAGKSKPINATDDGALEVAPTASQNPVYDHANGAKVTVTTTSTDILTPPAGCEFVRISAEADCFVRTDGSAAADNGGSIRIMAGLPEVIPVTAGSKVTAIVASGSTTVRATPLKARA